MKIIFTPKLLAYLKAAGIEELEVGSLRGGMC
jgi:hypothetical protein